MKSKLAKLEQQINSLNTLIELEVLIVSRRASSDNQRAEARRKVKHYEVLAIELRNEYVALAVELEKK